jgi:hypothetical protein
MSGIKARSGPPHNLNRSRRPWALFWRKRALRSEDRWILPIIEGYATGLASDKPNLTEAEKHMIEIGQISRGATMLILAEAARSGFIHKADGTWDLAPGAKELAKFLSIERSALATLGLARRARPAQSITEYLAGKAALPIAPDHAKGED